MNCPIAFEVPGTPVAKQRARRGRSGRWYTPRATRNYEEAVSWAARLAGIRVPFDGPVTLTIQLSFPDNRRRDIDNCAKSIMDALNGVAYVDDSQVARLDVTRQVDRLRPRAEVTVKHLSEALEPQKENYTR